MMISRTIPFITRPRRPFDGPPTPPTGPLQVLTATVVGFQEEAAIVSLIFNTSPAFPLASTSEANPEQWSMRYEGLLYVGSSIEAGAYNEVQLVMQPQNDSFESNSISYAAEPSDIQDTAGRELAAIEGMPVSGE